MKRRKKENKKKKKTSSPKKNKGNKQFTEENIQKFLKHTEGCLTLLIRRATQLETILREVST